DGIIDGASIRPRLEVEEKLRRLQHRLDDYARAFEEFAGSLSLCAERSGVALKLVLPQRPAKGAQPEGADELVPALHVGGGNRLAGYQAVDVAGAEGIERQLLGGRAVG